MQYTGFIAQNVAPPGATRIGLYDSDGNRIIGIPLGYLAFPPYAGDRLYSFGALSDVHYQYDTAAEDFRRALTYLNETVDVAFTCIAGDLTSSGAEWDLTEYRNAVAAHSPNTPVYAVTGNHEAIAGLDIANIIQNYTGKPLYYSFTHGDDVFIMVGIVGNAEGKLFAPGTLQWLYETLEANRNKRCFVFEHVRPQDGCGNAMGVYVYDIWGGTEATVFESLMKHYPNTILFHGHSHLKLNMQQYSALANYDNLFGNHSIHIPSLSVPRDINSVVDPTLRDVYADSEGYVVDVYEDGIMLKGRDFAADKYLPIATYWLDTPLKTVEAGTYKDLTRTINTQEE